MIMTTNDLSSQKRSKEYLLHKQNHLKEIRDLVSIGVVDASAPTVFESVGASTHGFG